jgi:hypothetical protein
MLQAQQAEDERPCRGSAFADGSEGREGVVAPAMSARYAADAAAVQFLCSFLKKKIKRKPAPLFQFCADQGNKKARSMSDSTP